MKTGIPPMLLAFLAVLILEGVLVASSFAAEPEQTPWPKPGFVLRTFVDEEGQESKYLVFLPFTDSEVTDGRYPVLVNLHGMGERGDDGLSSISNNFGRPIWEMRDHFPFIAVMPQCTKEESWQDEYTMQRTLAIIEEVMGDYACDPDRVYLMGVSSGVGGAMSMLEAQPERFTATAWISPAGSQGSFAETAKSLAESHIATWSCFNSRELVGNRKAQPVIRAELQKAGSECRFTTYEKGGHNTWDYGYRDPALYAWLLQHQKSRSIQNRFESLDFKPVSDSTLADEASLGNRIICADLSTGIENDGSRVLDFDCDFFNDAPIRLYLLGENVEKRETILLCSPAQIVASNNSTSPSTSFVGDSAIRRKAWNHLSMHLSNGQAELAVNGWTYWRSDPSRSITKLASIGFKIPSKKKVESYVRQARFRDQWIAETDRSAESPQISKNEDRKPNAPDTQLSPTESILSQLKTRSQQSDGLMLSWLAGLPPASSELANMLSRGTERKVRSLHIQQRQTYFQSSRHDNRPEGPNRWPNIDSSGIQFHRSMLQKEGNPSRYIDSLAAGFRYDQAITGQSAMFERVMSPQSCVEKRKVRNGKFSKVDRTLPELDRPINWTRLCREDDFSDQLDTLDQQSAILALGGLECSAIAVDISRLVRVAENQIIDGHPCVVLREPHPTDPAFHRDFWIDLHSGCLIRRFHGYVPLKESVNLKMFYPLPEMLGEVTIDIRYSKNLPVGWTIANRHSSQSPLRSVLASDVESRQSFPPQPKIEFPNTDSWMEQPMTWVQDQIAGSQHLVLAAGQKREVTDRELMLRPTFDDLATTSADQVQDIMTTSTVDKLYLIGLGLIGITLVLWGGLGRARRLKALSGAAL